MATNLESSDTRSVCALCKSVIDEQKNVVTCTNCNNNFHAKCVNVNLRGFHLKKNTWKCNTTVCCENNGNIDDADKDEQETDIFWNADGKIGEVKYLHYILKQKDEIIAELRSQNKLLHDYIRLVEERTDSGVIAKKPTQGNKPVLIIQDDKKCKQACDKIKTQNNNNVSHARTKDANIQGLESVKHQDSNLLVSANLQEKKHTSAKEVVDTRGKWQEVNRKYNRKPKIVTGTGENVNEKSNGFGAPEKKIWIHVGRCETSTTENDIHKHLQKIWPLPSFEVTKLNTKGTNTSFRVSTKYEETLMTELYNAANWPAGIIIKQYRFFRVTSGRFKS